MKRMLAICLACAFVFLAGCGKLAPNRPQDNSKPTQNTPQTGTTTPDKTPAGNKAPDPKPSTGMPKVNSKVKIFLIALDDNGKSGKKLETGDSLVAVDRTITTPDTPLRAAYEQMLSLKERNYGQSGLYNPLYNSNLKLDNVTVQNGLATVKLSGNFSLGGVMDNPRVEAQLKEIALQFSTVKAVEVYVNGKKLADALSLK